MATDTQALNLALDVLDLKATETNTRFVSTARGLMRGYHARWGNQQTGIELVDCERYLEAPLTNLDTGRNSRTFRIAGKLDKLARHNSRLCLFDHKTTSSDIADPASTYWRQLEIERQPSHYELLLLANGIRVDRIVWDVIRKPGIRPKNIAKATLAELETVREYCGYGVTAAAIEHAKEHGTENGELFEYRVASECVNDPDRYFARRGVNRTREGLADYGGQLWDMAKDMQLARLNNRHYQNSGACMNYGSACDFLGICSGHDTPDSERWQERVSVHPELPVIHDGVSGREGGVEDGRDLITNSRLSCFQTCRRKHFYKYELGIERVDAEDRESLYFGAIMHSALDAYWSASSSQEIDNGNCNEGPAIEVGTGDSSSAAKAGLPV